VKKEFAAKPSDARSSAKSGTKNLKLSKIAAKPLKFWGLAVAACGGEMRSD